MTQFNPFVNSTLQSPVVQRQQAAAKATQVRRVQQLARNVAAEDEQLESQVESSEELTPTRKQQDSDQRPKREPQSSQDSDSDQPHVDLTA
jgi:hypothetical protein